MKLTIEMDPSEAKEAARSINRRAGNQGSPCELTGTRVESHNGRAELLIWYETSGLASTIVEIDDLLTNSPVGDQS